MSELTPCNYCTLKAIRARAPKGVRTTTSAGKGEWAGWIVVKQTGRKEPVAYFMALTDHCVC